MRQLAQLRNYGKGEQRVVHDRPAEAGRVEWVAGGERRGVINVPALVIADLRSKAAADERHNGGEQCHQTAYKHTQV